MRLSSCECGFGMRQAGPEIVGNVLIHPTAKIGAGCKIGPDVVLGPNCVVGIGCRLQRCTLFEGCVKRCH
jgi:mannose-1-phosphate guanylyltransferase